MKRPLQGIMALIFTCCIAMVQSAEVLKEKWVSPVVGAGFSRELGMLDSEREEYSSHLAVLGTNHVFHQNGNAESLTQARRILGIALQLSPRNKQALVTCFQLSRGMLPEPTEGAMGVPAVARLLQARGMLLRQSKLAEDQFVGRLFVTLAAELDPKNEDAVYASEILRLDLGEVDWRKVTDAPAEVR